MSTVAPLRTASCIEIVMTANIPTTCKIYVDSQQTARIVCSGLIFRFVPSQWETSLQSNAVSHWLGANLESALCDGNYLVIPNLLLLINHLIITYFEVHCDYTAGYWHFKGRSVPVSLAQVNRVHNIAHTNAFNNCVGMWQHLNDNINVFSTHQTMCWWALVHSSPTNNQEYWVCQVSEEFNTNNKWGHQSFTSKVTWSAADTW